MAFLHMSLNLMKIEKRDEAIALLKLLSISEKDSKEDKLYSRGQLLDRL